MTQRDPLTVPGNFTPMANHADLMGLFDLPAVALNSPRHRGRMGGDDVRPARELTAEQMRQGIG